MYRMRYISLLGMFCFNESVRHAQTSYTDLQPDIGEYNVGFKDCTATVRTRTYNRHSEIITKRSQLEIPEGKFNYIGLQPSYHQNTAAAIHVFEFTL